MLQADEVDAVFLDIQMPGLTGLDLAQVLSRFRSPPPIVFVTAHEEHAVSAFELRAVDYVLKPVRAERLAEAVRRVVDAGGPAPSGDVQIAVERGGVTRFVSAPRSPTSRRRATTRGCTPPRGRTWCARRCRRWPRSGPRPASCASTARCSSRSPTSRRCAARAAGSASWSAGTELAVSRRHTRELRDLLTRREPLA